MRAHFIHQGRRLGAPGSDLRRVVSVVVTALLSLTFSVAASAAPSPVPADEVSFFGGNTMPDDQKALSITAGLADVEVGGLIGLSTLADVAPTVRFDFGRGLDRIGGGGATLGARFRMKFAQTRGWTIAVAGSPQLSLHLSADQHPPTKSESTTTVLFSPFVGSLTADRLLTPSLRLIVGLEAGVGFFFAPNTGVHTPIAFQVGTELRIAPSLFFLARLDAGVDLYSQDSTVDDASKMLFRFRLGLGWVR